jgi:hypothetical protein
MRKVHLLLVGLLAMSSTLLAEVPQVHPPTAVTTPAPAAVSSGASSTAAPLTLAAVFSPVTPTATQVCNLLCIVGDHCCIIQQRPTCIPDTVACP